MLVNGEWKKTRKQEDEQGRFCTPRNRLSPLDNGRRVQRLKSEAGRYHLYVSLACPWANRTLIMREIKGLTDAISLSIDGPLHGR